MMMSAFSKYARLDLALELLLWQIDYMDLVNLDLSLGSRIQWHFWILNFMPKSIKRHRFMGYTCKNKVGLQKYFSKFGDANKNILHTFFANNIYI